MKKYIARIIGFIGAIVCVSLYFYHPVFPSPDKIFVFLVFIFMIFNKALSTIKKLAPFIVILLAYDSFSNITPYLSSHIHYNLMPSFDEKIFGTLPTITLQHWFWHGTVTWYDYLLYFFYLLHFFLSIGLALLIYNTKKSEYWRFSITYLLTSFSAFLVFILYPTAPPWLASKKGYIPHIDRIDASVFHSIGIDNYSTIYIRFAPNPVASAPSLHTAFSVMFVLFVYKIYGKKWGTISLIYPFMIIFGIVYMGEHYVFDVICGALLAVLSYLLVPYLMKWLTPSFIKANNKAKYLFLKLIPSTAQEFISYSYAKYIA